MVVNVELSYLDHVDAAGPPALLAEFEHDLKQHLRTSARRAADVARASTNGPGCVAHAGDAPGPSIATPASVAGHPNATVSAGFAGSLPIGVLVIGGHGEDDAVLIARAAALR